SRVRTAEVGGQRVLVRVDVGELHIACLGAAASEVAADDPAVLAALEKHDLRSTRLNQVAEEARMLRRPKEAIHRMDVLRDPTEGRLPPIVQTRRRGDGDLPAVLGEQLDGLQEQRTGGVDIELWRHDQKAAQTSLQAIGEGQPLRGRALELGRM